jgi:hypothetical protein
LKTHRQFFFTVVLFMPLVVTAQQGNTSQAGTIYKVEREDGSIVYTDMPSQNAQPLQFDEKTQNQVTAIPTPKPTTPTRDKIKPNYRVTIASPAPEATIRNNTGNITIRATQPNSPRASRYRLVFDGQAIETNNSGIFQLKGVDRGAHQFKVELTDNKGKTLASSDEQTLFLHQASVFINRN